MIYVTVIVMDLGCLLVLFLQYIAGQLTICAIVRAVDKIASSQRKNKKRIYTSFIFFVSAAFNAKICLLYPNLHQTVLQEYSLFFYCQQNTLKEAY